MARKAKQTEFKGGGSGITKTMVDGWSSAQTALALNRADVAEEAKALAEEIKEAGVAADMFKFAHRMKTKLEPAVATAKAECLILILEHMGILDSLFSQRTPRGRIKKEEVGEPSFLQ